MILPGVLSWRDVLGYTDAWRVLVWFATLVTLADGIHRVGFLSWFAGRTVFFVAHYMLASLTAHATALLPVFLAAGMAMPDRPARPLALLLCYAIGLMGVLTPYATGPAPIYFASGYVTRPAFWALAGSSARSSCWSCSRWACPGCSPGSRRRRAARAQGAPGAPRSPSLTT